VKFGNHKKNIHFQTIIQMGIAVNGSHSKFLTRCRVITDIIRQKMEMSECLAEKFNSDSMQLPQNSQCSFCQWISFSLSNFLFWYSCRNGTLADEITGDFLVQVLICFYWDKRKAKKLMTILFSNPLLLSIVHYPGYLKVLI